MTSNPKNKATMVLFSRVDQDEEEMDFVAAEADLEPLAICRAAVAALSEEK